MESMPKNGQGRAPPVKAGEKKEEEKHINMFIQYDRLAAGGA